MQPSDPWPDTWLVALRLVLCKVAEAPQDARHQHMQISKAIVNLAHCQNLPRYDLVLTRKHDVHIMIDEQPKRRASTTGTLVGTRFQAPLLDAIDSWRKAQDDLPTRPEAVRRLVELGMTLKHAGVQLRRHAKPSDKNI